MIGKLITAFAGRSIARTLGGASAGPAGAMIGAAVPVVLPRVARSLGPVGMVAAAVGGVLFTRWMNRRAERKVQHATATSIGAPPVPPEAVLGNKAPPYALEGELVDGQNRRLH